MSSTVSPELSALFLKALLPESGYKCVLVLGPGESRRQLWASTAEDLAGVALREDREGQNVYHACSAFSAKSRKAKLSIGSKAFWLDVDAGETKPYPNMDAALAALQRFTLDAGLPPASVVSSGRGLHAYWFAKAAWGPEQWGDGARGLKQLCQQHGFHADPVRTADAASVLRPPGTHHRKNEMDVREVRILSFGGIHANEMYAHLFGLAPAPREIAPKPAGLTAAAANIYNEEPADADLIADRCRQVRDFRDLRGNIPEPQWYSAMAVIGRATGGRGVVHAWSSGDARYDQAATDAKLDRALNLSGPTTCAHFASINPSGCAGCPFAGRVTTPLQLGRSDGGDTQSRREIPVDHAGGRLVGHDVGPPSGVVCGDQPAPNRPQLPLGFQWGVGGQLQFLSETPKGEQKAITVCQYPIHLASVAVGELRTDKFGLAFRHWLPKEGWMEFTMPAKILGGPNAMATMLEKGVTIEAPEVFRKYVRDAMNQFYAERKLQVQFEQCGWKDQDQTFLVGSRLYTPEGVKAVAVSPDVQERGKYLAAMPGASLEQWTKGASVYAAAGCEMHLYALLAGFAAPFMKFLSADEGGGIISCVSSDSGRGKTLLLESIASIWGKLEGLRLLTSDTRVSKGLVFGSLGNLPVVFDEFDAKDPDHVLDFVQTFTTGRDKLRATQDGDLKAQGAKWQTILVSGSNRSLCDAIYAANNTAQTARIIELSMAPNDVLKTRGEFVRSTLKAHAGVAGDKYLRYLITPGVMPQVKAGMDAYRAKIEQAPWYKSEMRYWLRMQTAIGFAAVIVEKLGLIEFSAERIIRWGEALLQEMATLPAGESPVDQGAINRSLGILGSFMQDKKGEILVMPGPWKPRTKAVPYFTPPNKIVGRFNASDNTLYVDRPTLHNYVTREKKFPWKEWVRTLQTAGVITGTPRIVLAAGTDLAGMQVIVLEIDLKNPLANVVPKPTEDMGVVVPIRKTGEGQ
jgi:hypothetical protein